MTQRLFPVAAILLCAAAASAQPRGWRTDGTGRYPATEVTEWGPNRNVIWACEMPASSNATPVIVGQKLFVCAEPASLVCVSKATGALLWQRPHDREALMSEDDKAKMAKAEEINKRYRAARRQAHLARKAHRAAAKEDETKKSQLAAALEEARKAEAAARAELKPFEKYLKPRTHGVNGFSSPTPTTDGKHVYVLFGLGIAACYDLDGNRQWAVLTDRPDHGWGHSASPLLVGGKLIVHIKDMVALDPATGRELWRCKARGGWGSPVATRVGDVNVIITPKGDAVRASDGVLLARGLGKLAYASPVVAGETVYFIEHGGKAVRLSEGEDGKPAAETLWTTTPAKDRYYASVVVDDGLIYAVNQKSHFSVIDAADGTIVHEAKLKLKGKAYSSVTLTGEHLLVSGERGNTLVLTTGRRPRQVAENDLEAYRACPVVDAEGRIYIRGRKKLYCIGQKRAE